MGSTVVFLDIDGVLLPFGAGIAESSQDQAFPEACLAALSRLLELSGARVVLSSTWRSDPGAMRCALGQFQRYAARHGGPLAMLTSFRDTTSTASHTRRELEIDEWLRGPEAWGVEAWVALDDEDLLQSPSGCTPQHAFLGRVVQTQGHVGLTAEDAESAAALLRRQWEAVDLHRAVAADVGGGGPRAALEAGTTIAAPSEVTLRRWQQHRDEAVGAIRRKAWAVAAGELRQAVAVRPDWSQGYMGLYQALTQEGDVEQAKKALCGGTRACLARFRRALESGADPEDIADEAMKLVAKVIEKMGPDAPCTVLGSATEVSNGEPLLLYRSVACGLPWLAGAPRPLKVVFLDVDGVLNTEGSANSGMLCPELLRRLRQVLEAARAVAVLSSSWRSFDELRPLILGCLPEGRVVGQTPAGFQNHTRPREILDFLRNPQVRPALQVPGASWAAVDDMNLVAQARDLATSDGAVQGFLPDLQRRFVRTDKCIGLDEAGAAELMRILGAGDDAAFERAS